jgi:N-acetylmuramoyl-L-alanine amidase
MDPITLRSTGAHVEDVQRLLLGVGLTTGADEPGVFGPGTERAVRGLQQRHGLPADGVVDHETWQVLVSAAYQLGDRLLFRTRPLLRGEDIRDLQLRLSRLGFDAGLIDGVFGPDTERALLAFQSEVGLTVDGIVGGETLAQLSRLHREHHAAPASMARERSRVRRPLRTDLRGARILVDPANGPEVPGVVAADGTPEHAITWTLASIVAGRLTALGANTLLSRGPMTSPDAAGRAAVANEADVELIVSIGLNRSASPLASGATAGYFGTGHYVSELGRALADRLLARTVTVLGTPDCRSHPSTVSILRLSRAPAVVLEPGFLTNPRDAALLTDPDVQQRLADAVVASIADVLTSEGAGTGTGGDRTDVAPVGPAHR